LALVAQERPLGFDFAVREVVAMGRTAHRGRFARETKLDRDAINRAMESADVEYLAARSIRGISGGERQRVFLATALAQEPAVLLLDEPTTHLDLYHQAQIAAIVRERAREGTTVLIAIHDLTVAAQVSDRMCLMSHGQVVLTGEPDAVLIPSNLKRTFGVNVVVGTHPAPPVTYVLPLLSSSKPDT